MEKEWGARGFAFAYLDVTPAAGAIDAKRDAAKYGLTGRTIADAETHLAEVIRAKSTAEVFVLDASRTLRYRGAVDDQYGIGWHKPAATKTYLRDALERVSAGRDVATPATEASGCMLAIDADAAGAPLKVTYHNRVSRIIQKNCQMCHRDGGQAPIPLENYDQVYGRRAVIQYMVTSGRMPPWFAHKDIGTWSNDASLPERDKKDLIDWIKSGAPEGDKKDAPQPAKWVAGWNIGKPDAVVRINEVQKVPAQGVVEYRYVYVKTDFPEDKWIQAMEIRPTAPKVVHHVLVFLEDPAVRDSAIKGHKVRSQGGIDGFFAATAPGRMGVVFPENIGKKLPKGAWLKFQIHYTPNGTEQTDQTELGLVFSDKPPQTEMRTSSAFNAEFVIPPGAAHHEVKAEYTFRRAGTMYALFPHMHLRGSAFRYDLVLPDSTVKPILWVPKYDFNWQTYYQFKTPLDVPAGAKLRATAWYDNSKENPFNPDATKEVRFGEQTFEEMMIGYFDWVAKP
jgi:hypothetical protein